MENAHFSRWFFNPRQSERSSEQVWMWRILLLGMLFVCLQFIIFFSFLLPSASARSYSFSFAVFQMLCIYVGTRYVPGYVKCDVFVSTLSLRRKHNRRNCGIQCHCQHVFFLLFLLLLSHFYSISIIFMVYFLSSPLSMPSSACVCVSALRAYFCLFICKLLLVCAQRACKRNANARARHIV